MIAIDHIFVFSTYAGKEADELITKGLKEGEGRAHPGQGTINRKFLFSEFFLEILWVHNRKEINRPEVSRTSLDRRSQFQKYGLSPFGLCLVNTPETDSLFQQAIRYQPDYFPKGQTIDVIPHDNHPSLPWLFRLPFRKGIDSAKKQVEGSVLQRATFSVSKEDANTQIASFLNATEQIQLIGEDKNWLNLSFKNPTKQAMDSQSLPVSIHL